MASESELPPTTLPEILEGIDKQGVDAHGWYADSAEGVLVPYTLDPQELEQVMKAVATAAANPAT
jgi:hypothetical protein